MKKALSAAVSSLLEGAGAVTVRRSPHGSDFEGADDDVAVGAELGSNDDGGTDGPVGCGVVGRFAVLCCAPTEP